jgi:hypothetical protein
VPVLALHGSGDMRPSDSGYIIANNSTANIAVTIVTGGSAIVEVTKDTTYSTDPSTGASKMKLIRETIDNVKYLTEETEDGKKKLYIEGTFLVGDASQ